MEEVTESATPQGEVVRPVHYRWVVLAVFSILTCLNCIQWILFAPIENTVRNVIGCTRLQVDALSLVFMVTYAILAIPALRITDQFGLRGAMVTGAVTQAAGAWIRICWSPSSSTSPYLALISGQLIISLGQLPLLGLPPKLSLVWFGPDEWALATSVGVLSNQAGGAIAYLASPQAVSSCNADDDNGQQSARRELHGYLLAQAAACSVAALTALLLIPPRPPRHASRASQLADLDIAGADGHQAAASWKFFCREIRGSSSRFLGFSQRGTIEEGGYRGLNNSDRERNLIQSTAALVSDVSDGAVNPMAPKPTTASMNANGAASAQVVVTKGRLTGLLLTVAYGLAVGCSYAISTLLSQLVEPLGLGGGPIGWAGFIVTVVGLAGSVAAGLLLDRHRALQWHILRGLLVASTLATIFLALVVAARARRDAASESNASSSSPGAILLFAASGILGFFLTAVFPVGFELAADYSYPASPDGAAAILNIAAQLFGIALILICNGILFLPATEGTTTAARFGGATIATLALAAALAVAALCSSAVRGVNRRQEVQEGCGY